MASSSTQWAYDVFVSFKGEDIGKSFMDHLFSDFKRKGIYAYRDSDSLKTGEETCSDIYRAIEQSRCLIIIFSDNYALSTCCLNELSRILECKEREKDKYEVRTIFYNVKPSVVRNQTGSYKEAFLKHEASNRTEVCNWKKSLTFAANLSGWDLQDITDGYESKFIDMISKDIFYKLIDGPLYISNHLVRLYARAEQMDLLQFVGSNKVHMIGICGIGGIGKTTIAKAIYNLMYKHFEGCSFCEDVKGVVSQHGLVHLQMKLLDDIMKMGDLNIQSVPEGISIMKRRMRAKKALIILDDVDQFKHFEALAGKPDWFGPGSMIVVTSRDRQLLNACKLEQMYEVGLLNNDESHELFCMYAFRDKHPQKEFIELANGIIHHVNGLPLALKTFGRLLFSKTTLKEWESEIDKLQSNPNVLTQQVFRLSYDELDADQKNIFLDIACFFKGEKKDNVLKILDGCESFSATNLRVLVDKSLITICEDRLQMHNLVQEMGWQIVREESEEPGKRSRLWHPTDVCNVLQNDEGTELVKGLALDASRSEVKICSKSFTKLKNLRLLHLYIGSSSNIRDINGKKCKSELGKESKVSMTSEKLEFLSSELQFLCWHGYPFQQLPSTFCPESLLVLDMSYSCIKQIWSGSKSFRKLTLLKLSHCRNLTQTPDFIGTPNLTELILEGCENLVGVHPSVGSLKMLLVLNLENCKNLRRFPNITESESLQYLSLSGCSKVEKLPEDLGKIKALVELRLDGTAVKVVPSSVFSLGNLEVLSLGCSEIIQSKSWRWFFLLTSFLRQSDRPPALVLPSLSSLSSLRVLNVSQCGLSGASLSNLASSPSLEELDLSGNDFSSIEANFSHLSRLSCLRLIGCTWLEILPELPSSILNLDAQHCTSLQELPKLSTTYNVSKAIFDFKNCPKVVEKHSIESLVMMLLPQGRIDIFEEVNIFLPGSRIPGWFSYHSMGDCIRVDLPPHWCYKKFKGLATCAVVTPENPGSRSTYFDIFCTVKNFHGALISDVSLLATDDPNIASDQMWLCYKKSDPRWEEAKNYIMVSFNAVGINCKVKQCSVRLVCEEDEQEAASGSKMIQWFPTVTADNGGVTGGVRANLDVKSVVIEDEPPRKKFCISKLALLNE